MPCSRLTRHRRKGTVLPSIGSLISIDSSKTSTIRTLIHSVYIACLSKVSRLSVANTAVVFHDGRLLATCESGPPVHVAAPQLETIGFHVFPDGATGEGGLGRGKLVVGSEDAYGALPVAAKMLEEWTTAHPKRDPVNGDLVFMGYNIFQRPFITYSVVAADGSHRVFKRPVHIPCPKMIHDIPVSRKHTVILDLPLVMDPLAPFKPGGSKPMVHFDRSLRSRFGILPRLYTGARDEVRWFEADPCLIFHAANTWDEPMAERPEETAAVCMLACRFNSAKLVHAAAGQRAPEVEEAIARESTDGDAVKLTYLRFSLHPDDPSRPATNEGSTITHQFVLSAVPFEFPVVPFHRTMQRSRYVYGLSLRSGSFAQALEGAKPDVIVRLDVERLIAAGHARWADGTLQRDGIVDLRTVQEILASDDAADAIRCYALPPRHFASEPSFIPRADARDECDGYLVFYVFDESQLAPNGDAPDTATSELWILDAADLATLVGRVRLPSRVPYGLHGTWLSPTELARQRHLADPALMLNKRVQHVERAAKAADRAAWIAKAFAAVDAYTIIVACGLLGQAFFVWALAGGMGPRSVGSSEPTGAERGSFCL
jgi:carotenoid cleavage dioxygenase-like enzyme